MNIDPVYNGSTVLELLTRDQVAALFPGALDEVSWIATGFYLTEAGELVRLCFPLLPYVWRESRWVGPDDNFTRALAEASKDAEVPPSEIFWLDFKYTK